MDANFDCKFRWRLPGLPALLSGSETNELRPELQATTSTSRHLPIPYILSEPGVIHNDARPDSIYWMGHGCTLCLQVSMVTCFIIWVRKVGTRPSPDSIVWRRRIQADGLETDGHTLQIQSLPSQLERASTHLCLSEKGRNVSQKASRQPTSAPFASTKRWYTPAIWVAITH
jgi:hypothetical protein